MKPFYLLFFASIVAVVSASGVSNGLNVFNTKLYAALQNKDDNLIFSPYSVHTILSLVYQGASGGTADALRTGLIVTDPKTTAEEYKRITTDLNGVRNITVQVANKIYVMKGYKLKDAFRETAQGYFSASADNVDFARSQEAADEINEWVKRQTENKIDQLVKSDDLSGDTRLVLLNAIYFKGFWLKKFKSSNTKLEKFHISETKSVDCRMMHQVQHFQYADNDDLGAKLLKMKYKDERFAMVIVLPNSKTGIKDLERKLLQKDTSSVIYDFGELKRVDVSIPQFKFEALIELNEPLKEMGFRRIFSAASEFPNMIDPSEPLSVDKVVQKAYIEVDERGAKAAAATAVTIVHYSAIREPPPLQFRADHPFIFYITAELDGEKIVLFMGKMMSPKIT